MPSRTANIYSIPPGCNFLATLADALVTGRLIEGFTPLDDPLLLSTATIYVPTRRAARTLSAEILTAMQASSAILPDIRTLGDGDDDELHFSLDPASFQLPEEISALERKLQLFRMVQTWTNAISRETQELFGDEDIVIPSSPAEAMWLAGDLARLIDQLATEEISWDKVAALEPEGHPQWWQLTLAFLKIAMETWPEHLAEIGKVEAATRRSMLLDHRTQYYKENAAPGPVIAAGSTGTIPATQRLLKTIAGMDNGAVILPGLDMEMGRSDWEFLISKEALVSTPNQPQYGLANLLNALHVDQADVIQLGPVGDDLKQRERLFSLALAPAEFSDTWRERLLEFTTEQTVEAPQEIYLLEAPGERQEASAIALAMREVLEHENQTVALVTPDRNIARRVSSELARFGVEIDDSAGQPLSASRAAIFLRCLMDVALGEADAVSLVSLLKNTNCRLGLGTGRASKMALLFELAMVRGQIMLPEPGNFAAFCVRIRKSIETARHLNTHVRAMGEEDWDNLSEYCRLLDLALQPMVLLRNDGGMVGLDTCLEAVRQTAAQLSLDEIGNEIVFAEQGGPQIASLFTQLAAGVDRSIRLTVSQFPPFFEALLGDQTIRDASGRFHPRLHILGPLEARLQHFDRVILAGLNEGTWPSTATNDPFLNRVMRAQLGLSLPERRIGLSAHDFQQLCGNRQVFLTRSTQVDNAPTVASRWIQRLCTVAGETASTHMVQRGRQYLDWVEMLDASDTVPERALRPNPKPPVALRPDHMPVTDVETWIRDPYAIYAKYLLGLRPLDPLERDADPALKGILYHAILARFVDEGIDPASIDAIDRMMTIAHEEFVKNNVPEEAAALWLPRFANVARLYLEWDREHWNDISKSLVEISGERVLADGRFKVTARADRLDIYKDGSVTILDYKTGKPPTLNEARRHSPQLPLEGAIAMVGGFENVEFDELKTLTFVHLKPDEFRATELRSKNITSREVAEEAYDKLEAHYLAYSSAEQGYLSRYAPKNSKNLDGDYDHLARTREWYSGSTDEGESGG